MSLKKKLLSIAAVLLVLGGLLLAFGDTRGPEPEVECALEGTPTSGYMTDKCPDGTTIESQKEWGEWYSMPRYGRIAGLGIVVVSIIVGIVGLASRPKKPVVEQSSEQ